MKESPEFCLLKNIWGKILDAEERDIETNGIYLGVDDYFILFNANLIVFSEDRKPSINHIPVYVVGIPKHIGIGI